MSRKITTVSMSPELVDKEKELKRLCALEGIKYSRSAALEHGLERLIEKMGSPEFRYVDFFCQVCGAATNGIPRPVNGKMACIFCQMNLIEQEPSNE